MHLQRCRIAFPDTPSHVIFLHRCIQDSTIFICMTHGSLVAGDMIVLILTWIKTFHQWRLSRTLGIQLRFSTCLLRDGTLFFSDNHHQCNSPRNHWLKCDRVTSRSFNLAAAHHIPQPVYYKLAFA
ncbi:hypothetical protein PHLGIDRAFT_477840 [Phlebiopsis gigantea 11061_1 CR5-6]|uniref:Uncharacterized protein n=1 Tax=Phlebiopsis gigantea (strain 11061_1 CR5-6) TaxID=745531 RepID=A0A0C3S9B2_PHLG1|nr:hypothetical protein PHLGIDRAFT_477840 [Phlebiopsis gigantea 11061_1 CR5-6]